MTIPNANLANNPIENVNLRPAACRVVTLLVAGQTPAEKLGDVLRALQGVFEQDGIRGPVHPVIGNVAYPPQVHFEDIQAGNFRLTVTYWYAPATDPDYAAHAERGQPSDRGGASEGGRGIGAAGGLATGALRAGPAARRETGKGRWSPENLN